MKQFFLAAAILVPAAAHAGCNAWDYTPWECGYAQDMKNRQADLEDRQRRLEDRQRQDDLQRSRDAYEDALFGRRERRY